MDDDAELSSPRFPPRRRRPALSCTVCRRRKLKCDRSLPCAQCVKSKTPDSCVYAGPKPGAQSTRPAGPCDNPAGRASPVHSGLFVFDSKHQLSTRVTKPRGRPDEVHELRNRVQVLEHALSRTNYSVPTPETMGGDSVSDASLLRMATATDLQLSENVKHLPERCSFRGKGSHTRYCGRCHWGISLSLMKDFGLHILGHKKKDFKSKNPEYMHLKGFKAEIWSREQQEHQRTYREKAFRLDEMIPPKRVADELLHVYLSTFETTYRIFHVPSFLRQYDAFWEGSGTPPDMVFLAKLLAAMAASSCFFSPTTRLNEKETLHAAAAGWILAVQSWIGSSLVSSTIDFNMLQIQCLLIIARQADASDGDLVWIASGSLIRTAMTMGLHRSPLRFPKVNKFWAEMRRRLWATILELDLQSALDGGMVPSIDLDEYDCEPPLSYDDHDLTEDMTEYPMPKESASSSLLALLARSLPLRVRIAKRVNSLNFTLSYDDALRMSEQLDRFANDAMASSLSASTSEGDDRVFFARSFYDFLMRRFLLVLHRPFSLSIAVSPKYSYSRKICLENALHMLSLLDPPAVSLPEAEACPHLGKLSGGMFREEFFHAAITVCVELSLQADESVSTKPAQGQMSSLNTLADLARSQQEVLIRAVEHSIDTFGSRITPKGKGCKPFFFLSMALASVKARIYGEDPSKQVEQVACRTMQQCERLLRGESWDDIRRRTHSISTPMLTPGLNPATPDLSLDPNSWMSMDLSPLDFGNLFGTGDYGLPDLWNHDFVGGF